MYKVREDPLLDADERTYTAAINCFERYTSGQPVVSLSSTMAGFDIPPSVSTMTSPAIIDPTKGGTNPVSEGDGPAPRSKLDWEESDRS